MPRLLAVSFMVMSIAGCCKHLESSGLSSAALESPFDLDPYGSTWIIARTRVGYIGADVHGGPGGQVVSSASTPGCDTSRASALSYRYKPVRLDIVEILASRGVSTAPQAVLARSLTAFDVTNVAHATNGPDMDVPPQLSVGDMGIAKLSLTPSLLDPTPTPPAEEGTGFQDYWLYNLQDQLSCPGCPIAVGIQWFERHGDQVIFTTLGDRMDQASFMSKISDIAQTFPPP